VLPRESGKRKSASAEVLEETMNLADLNRRMQGAVAALKTELGGLRTGRASVNLLEPIHVEAYGQSMPINQVGTVSVPEPRMLSVQVWDKLFLGSFLVCL
jgi:ribosome recycling factor